jgi:hypothetical protein
MLLASLLLLACLLLPTGLALLLPFLLLLLLVILLLLSCRCFCCRTKKLNILDYQTIGLQPSDWK